jgi:hypothetical protein
MQLRYNPSETVVRRESVSWILDVEVDGWMVKDHFECETKVDSGFVPELDDLFICHDVGLCLNIFDNEHNNII